MPIGTPSSLAEYFENLTPCEEDVIRIAELTRKDWQCKYADSGNAQLTDEETKKKNEIMDKIRKNGYPKLQVYYYLGYLTIS